MNKLLNRREPNNRKKGKTRTGGGVASTAVPTTTGCAGYHGPTVVVTGLAGLLVSPVASS